MLAIKILQKLVKSTQAPKKKADQSLSGFNVDVQPSMSEILAKAAQNQTTKAKVKFSGDVPSASSELAQNFASVGAAYGLAKITLEKQTNPKLGAFGNDVPAVIGISLGSWFASNMLQYYVFDPLLGTAIPETTIEIDVDNPADLEKSQLLKSSGISSDVAANAIQGLIGAELVSSTVDFIEFFANAYHGYQRHDKSLLAGIGWGLFGNIGMAIQQGYGLPMEHKAESKFLDMPSLVPVSNPKARRKTSSKAKARKRKTHSKVSARKVRSRKTSKVASKSRKTHRSRKTKK